jgi:cadmium resistance protein CadD (predicted permease)
MSSLESAASAGAPMLNSRQRRAATMNGGALLIVALALFVGLVVLFVTDSVFAGILLLVPCALAQHGALRTQRVLPL